ncbi:MAG: family 78 glycoside hydrolase catalytic domain [Bacteroidales bacterium]|nr:family 78 glycoside hydrolase catalytic domain [Bacteroidales bacterium]
MWCDTEEAKPDSHVAFRGKFSLESDTDADLEVSGASWYVIWIDGTYYDEGPDRYNKKFPEYQCRKIHLPKGEHTIAVQVHFEGVVTRILYDIQPFLYFRLSSGKEEIPVLWKCEPLKGYSSKVRRVNPQLGWVEWADTRLTQDGWQEPGYDDSAWHRPVFVKRDLGSFAASKIAPVKHLSIRPQQIGSGKLAEVFGYVGDNPGASFFLRDLNDERYPAQGVWFRYDLGRVRLARPKLKLDLPAGAVVEIAYSEALSNGRVAPWITLSAGDSYNLDRFIARGGEQEFFPLTPHGGRFVEVHILAPTEQIKLLDDTFIERCYYDEADGDFRCSDPLLNKIWHTGVETYKACSEDALIDNPTRERGQWLGDVGIVGIEIGASAFSDVSIIRRGLVQSAQCADGEGLVAGLCPGGEAFMSSYALQWVPACLSYLRLTGDRSILNELYDAAERNIAVFDRYITDEGIVNCPYWGFIDWGYVPNEGPSDMALNLHYMIAVQNMEQWSELTGRTERAAFYREKAGKFSRILQNWYASYLTPEKNDFDAVGYHRTVLGLKARMIAPDKEAAAIAFIKKHILNCFPNNPDAPRLSDPMANNPQLITPYFAHYAFPVLMENGESDFVLDQYRKCWGWALEGGRTTWIEVFDTRWTHCHQWSGAPTWQLSRYALGLMPRFDRKKNSFDLKFHPGSLEQAEGKVPLPSGKSVSVKWERSGKEVRFEIITPEAIELFIPNGKQGKTVRVKHKTVLHLPAETKKEAVFNRGFSSVNHLHQGLRCKAGNEQNEAI